MDWSLFLEEFKKNKLPVLIFSGILFLIIFLLVALSGGSSKKNGSTVTPPQLTKKNKANPLQRDDLHLDLSDKRGLNKMRAFFVRRAGKHLYKMRLRSYQLTEDELLGKLPTQKLQITPFSKSNQVRKDLLDKPDSKIETEMIFKRRKSKKLKKKNY